MRAQWSVCAFDVRCSSVWKLRDLGSVTSSCGLRIRCMWFDACGWAVETMKTSQRQHTKTINIKKTWGQGIYQQSPTRPVFDTDLRKLWEGVWDQNSSNGIHVSGIRRTFWVPNIIIFNAFFEQCWQDMLKTMMCKTKRSAVFFLEFGRWESWFFSIQFGGSGQLLEFEDCRGLLGLFWVWGSDCETDFPVYLLGSAAPSAACSL